MALKALSSKIRLFRVTLDEGHVSVGVSKIKKQGADRLRGASHLHSPVGGWNLRAPRQGCLLP